MFPWDIQVSGTLQSLAGPPITATYPAGTALIALSLNRNLSGGVRTANVELVQPGTTYGDRMYQVDFRVGKAFKRGSVRIQPELNVYNLFNADPVVRINTAFGPQWLRPQGVLLGRFAKIGASIRF
jgi:outer membrane receptor protein involved in Fe transport